MMGALGVKAVDLRRDGQCIIDIHTCVRKYGTNKDHTIVVGSRKT